MKSVISGCGILLKCVFCQKASPRHRRGGRLCPPPLCGSHSRRAGPVCPASPRNVYRHARLNGTRQRQPIVGAGLTPRALAPPTAHSSQGVAGAAPPAPIGASTSVGRDDPRGTGSTVCLFFAGCRRGCPPLLRCRTQVGEDRVVLPYTQNGTHPQPTNLFRLYLPRKAGHIGPALRRNGASVRRAGPMCPASPRNVHRYGRLNGTRQRQPIVGAGLTPRALAPPTAHSSQGVAGAAPPAPIGASTSVGRDLPRPAAPGGFALRGWLCGAGRQPHRRGRSRMACFCAAICGGRFMKRPYKN